MDSFVGDGVLRLYGGSSCNSHPQSHSDRLSGDNIRLKTPQWASVTTLIAGSSVSRGLCPSDPTNDVFFVCLGHKAPPCITYLCDCDIYLYRDSILLFTKSHMEVLKHPELEDVFHWLHRHWTLYLPRIISLPVWRSEESSRLHFRARNKSVAFIEVDQEAQKM